MPANYEIDFLAVGEGTRGGDAIAMRYGDPGSSYNIHVVDGGDKDSGERLVAHIQKYYGTNAVDFAVLTHADMDHASGLRVVLEQCRVTHLIMNRPWIHAELLVDRFKDQRWTVEGLRKRLRSDFSIIAELEELAVARGSKSTMHFRACL
jgi:beta-lactamase superfamily II metal-dependent hydrolase